MVGEPIRGETLGDIDPHLVEAFETAFSATRQLTFTYCDQQGRRTDRQVEPHGLLVRQPIWYVIAWDLDRNAPRLFRADRVRTPTVSDRTFVARPSEVVTGVCPNAKPVATVRGSRQGHEMTQDRSSLGSGRC
jgi:predicted DNA-binding transcriptional regulator YafY